MSALVVDGYTKSALAITRSLGRAGIVAWVGSEYEFGMAQYSRYRSGRFTYPSPKTDREGYVAAIEREAKKLLETTNQKPVIFSGSDASLLPLLDARERLEAFAVLPPVTEAQRAIVFDKAKTNALAEQLDIATIRTQVPESKEALELAITQSVYPLVIKPRGTMAWNNGRGVARSRVFVFSKEEAREQALLLFDETGRFPLMQPLIVGDEFGVEGVVKDGQFIAWCAHKRIRSLSPTGGAATTKITIAGDDALRLKARADKLVAELTWSGPMMVEFKIETETGAAYLMEMNGRWWGSLPLALAAGVALPVWYYRMMREEALLETPLAALPNVTTQHVLGDVKYLIQVLFARDPMRPLLYPTRGGALASVVRDLLTTKKDVWSLRDPLPAIIELWWILTRA